MLLALFALPLFTACHDETEEQPDSLAETIVVSDAEGYRKQLPPAFWRAVFPWQSPMPASGPAWADCSPGRAASCWGWSRWRFFATAPSASGSAPWGRSTACSTGSLSAVWRSTPSNALPVGHAARRAKWMWRCSAPPTTASASGAGTVWQPAPMGPSPGHFP